MDGLQYTTVIVTRHRPEALALSLPLILGQSHPPARTLVVDSSDDPSENQAIVAANRAASGQHVDHMASPPGMTVQRNVGLAKVDTPIVFFPDDDSLLHPGTMAEIMQAYAQDTEGLVGGVCAAEALTPPDGALSDAKYAMSLGDRLRKPIAATRFWVERKLAPEPFLLAARRLMAERRYPDWVDGETIVPVEWMTGFRMSFRTDLIRAQGFDETLGRYAQFEDTDASLKILKSHALIGVRRAQIYHYKAPARRSGGFTMGAIQILNRAYLLARHAVGQEGIEDRLSRQLRTFSAYKCLQYRFGARSEFGRDRLAGAQAAMGYLDQLARGGAEAAPKTYLAARQELGLEA